MRLDHALQAQDLAVRGGQSLFEFSDALAVGGAVAAEGFGEGVDDRAVVG
ncbi:hypothetical protein [Embleya hyalina]|uniref:Uncharacterized protein n=1 Tax=Embleya hyalina TaxID=516124 RepID=A0A401YX12_9ACTN|nr:hypothetical protein [Embleya hyalina]GCD99111.1 hypothetical protein EHYA_06823 [Embleya hyalina]